MRVLVTGASGFLGRHVIDSLTRGAPDGRPRPQVRALVRRPSMHLDGLGIDSVLGDVASERICARAVEQVDAVYHLAGLVSRRDADAAASVATPQPSA